MTRGIGSFTVAATLVLTALAAPAAADPSDDVPANATITIEGDGSGHGRGMSQYGAYGAASEGRKVGEILDFYYPETSIGRIAGKVRVWISRDDGPTLRIADEQGLTVRAAARKWTPSIPRVTQWRVKSQGAKNVISYRTRSWHAFRTVRADVTFSAGRTPLTLRTPDGPIRFRGALTSTEHNGDRITVNTLPLEQYLRGVVPSEMPASRWPQHALRAQAVAARTYAAFERSAFRTRAYDVCDTAACQNYLGEKAEVSRSDTAVRKTARDVLTYRSDLAFAQYSASNGGYTVAGNRPYLPAQKDEYEGTSSDYYGWTVTISSAALEEFYNLENLTRIQVSQRNGQGPRGGRVTELLLTTEGGDAPDEYSVDVDRFVSSFGLKSSLFEVTDVS